jgi:hypothetical protein
MNSIYLVFWFANPDLNKVSNMIQRNKLQQRDDIRTLGGL